MGPPPAIRGADSRLTPGHPSSAFSRGQDSVAPITGTPPRRTFPTGAITRATPCCARQSASLVGPPRGSQRREPESDTRPLLSPNQARPGCLGSLRLPPAGPPPATRGTDSRLTPGPPSSAPYRGQDSLVHIAGAPPRRFLPTGAITRACPPLTHPSPFEP